jgi:hypothetical protein
MSEHYTGRSPIPPELAKPLADLESAGRRFGSVYTTNPDVANNDLLNLEIAAIEATATDLQTGLRNLRSQISRVISERKTRMKMELYSTTSDKEEGKIFATIKRLLDEDEERRNRNKELFEKELLPFLGRISVDFNQIETDLKVFLILLTRNILGFKPATAEALEMRNAQVRLDKVWKHFKRLHLDPARANPTLVTEFWEIKQKINALRMERNQVLHSVWFVT